MAANCDDHTKNVSFLLRERERWELAPAYDVTHAYNPKGEWTYQHLMVCERQVCRHHVERSYGCRSSFWDRNGCQGDHSGQ
ncbi:MAG TPA: HipA domain-containing protein [Candidatus Angelobacter sp.]